MTTLNLDANQFYSTIRRAALKEMQKTGGGHIVVHALAVLLGEAIASAPIELQQAFGDEALATVQTTWGKTL